MIKLEGLKIRESQKDRMTLEWEKFHGMSPLDVDKLLGIYRNA